MIEAQAAILAGAVAALLLMGAAKTPVDVPPISEKYWMQTIMICMDTCPAPNISLTPPKDNDGSWREYTSPTCADRTRFLMTSEDGIKHCISL